jgi:hypothetical protein
MTISKKKSPSIKERKPLVTGLHHSQISADVMVGLRGFFIDVLHFQTVLYKS